MTDEAPQRRGFIRGQFYSRAERRARKIAFLAALVEGHTALDAAERVGVPFHTFYSWRRSDPPFRQAWKEAMARAAVPERDYPLPPAPKPAPPKPTITVRDFDLPVDENG